MKKSVSVSYKIVGLAVLAWVVSMNAMESREDLVTSKEIKDLTQSIREIEEDNGASLKDSRKWISSLSDWWYGLDTNVVSELTQGTLTKDMVAQDTELQRRAYIAIDTAIAKNRTENLCALLNQLNRFDMLNLETTQHTSTTEFLNKEINVACEQKASAKLINVLNTMKTTDFVVDNTLLDAINEVLNEQKQTDVQTFKTVLQSTQAAVLKLQEQMIKDKEQYKGPLLQAQEILLLQKYLAHEALPKGKQVKKDLAIANEAEELDNLFKAVKTFADKK